MNMLPIRKPQVLQARRHVLLLVSAVALFLGACSGESTRFTEAVEIDRLQLASLRVVPPASSVLPLVSGSNQKIAFALVGTNNGGKDVPVSSVARRWSSSNPAVASINPNGLLQTIGEGKTTIGSNIGGIVAATFELSVSDSPLVSISSIEGKVSVQRCRPEDYTALGFFEDNSTRALGNVVWSVDDIKLGGLNVAGNGGTRLSALEAGTIVLQAKVGAITEVKSIEIQDTLTELELVSATGNFNVTVGQTLAVAAEATYVVDGQTNRLTISENVLWEVPASDGFVTVSNTAGSKGTVTGVAAGSTTISAACGSFATGLQQVTAMASTTTGISFNVAGSSFNLQLSAGTFDLKLSTGSTYSDSTEITTSSSTQWSEVSGTSVSVNNTTNKGKLTLLGTGTSVIKAEYTDSSNNVQSKELTINVQ